MSSSASTNASRPNTGAVLYQEIEGFFAAHPPYRKTNRERKKTLREKKAWRVSRLIRVYGTALPICVAHQTGLI